MNFKLRTQYGYVCVRVSSETPDSITAILKIVDTRVSPPHCRYAKICVSLQNIRKEVIRCLHEKGLTDPVSGFSWKDLKRMTKATTRKVGSARLLNVVKKISTEADKYSSSIYPPLGVSYSEIRKASQLLRRAESGSKAAEGVIMKIKRGAMRGLPDYQKAAKVLVTLHEASKSIDIDTWLSARVSGLGGRQHSRTAIAIGSSSSFYRAGLLR